MPPGPFIQCQPVSRDDPNIGRESILTGANLYMDKRTGVAQCHPSMVLQWSAMKLKNLNLLILSRCRLESHQVEGICWDRPQDDLCPGSDVYQQSALAMESVWPWLRYQSGNSLSQTRLNKLIFILTWACFCHRQVYYQCFSQHSHIYFI